MQRSRWIQTALEVLGLLLTLYGFFLSLELVSIAFKLFGRGLAQQLIATTSNPFVGLFIGILATSLVQSSSTVTTMVVSLVAAGGLTIETAIPIVMGANVGTSVTNTLVSLGHITRGEEFRRALAGATVHDFFNLMAVLILFPLELFTGYLHHFSGLLAALLEGIGGVNLLSPVKLVVKPAAKLVQATLDSNGTLVFIVAVALLFFALRGLTALLRRLVLKRSEAFLHRYLFRSDLIAMAFGALLTVLVQSSSITTSVIIPLVGAGILSLEQIFPYTLGANVGTTITAMLAALITASPSAVVVAFAHLLFNVSAIVILYPLRVIRSIPLRLARGLSQVTSRSRVFALVYIALVFFLIPLGLINVAGSPATIETLRIAGSDSMSPLLRSLASEYGKIHVLVNISIEDVGSILGLQRLRQGEVEIAASSVEPSSVLGPDGAGLRALEIARDGLTILVHRDNPVNDLSLPDLQQIYSGQLREWAAVGGPSRNIVLLIRNANSGSVAFLRQTLLGGAAPGSFHVAVRNNEEALGILTQNLHCIAFASSAQVDSDQVKPLALGGVLPTSAAIGDGSYPLSRRLYLVTESNVAPHVQRFLEFARGEQASRIATSLGYEIPTGGAPRARVLPPPDSIPASQHQVQDLAAVSVVGTLRPQP